MLAFEDTDATFDASMKATTASEPGLLLMLVPWIIFVPNLGQDDPFNAYFCGIRFVVRRVKATISTCLERRLFENLEMMVNGWLPLFFIGWVAVKDWPTSDDPPINFIEPHFVTKLGLFARFLAPNDVGMSFKDADDFLWSRNRLAIDDPAHGLGKGLFYPRDVSFKGLDQLLSPLACFFLEGYPECLAHAIPSLDT